jgi:hypothetical protein
VFSPPATWVIFFKIFLNANVHKFLYVLEDERAGPLQRLNPDVEITEVIFAVAVYLV